MRKQMTAAIAVLFLASGNIAYGANAKAGFDLDYANVKALSRFTFVSSDYDIEKRGNGAIPNYLKFKKSSTRLGVTIAVIQDPKVSAASYIEGQLAGTTFSNRWQNNWQRDTSHYPRLGDLRWGRPAKVTAKAITGTFWFSRSNIVCRLSCNDAALNLHDLAEEIDDVIKALPDINSNNIGNYTPTLSIVPDAHSLLKYKTTKLTVTTSDPNGHNVVTGYDDTLLGLTLSKASHGYDIRAGRKPGTFKAVVVAVNSIGLFVEKEVSITVTVR